MYLVIWIIKRKKYYINDNTFNINKYELFVLSLHEGIPGHHLQLHYKINQKARLFKIGDKRL